MPKNLEGRVAALEVHDVGSGLVMVARSDVRPPQADDESDEAFLARATAAVLAGWPKGTRVMFLTDSDLEL